KNGSKITLFRGTLDEYLFILWGIDKKYTPAIIGHLSPKDRPLWAVFLWVRYLWKTIHFEIQQSLFLRQSLWLLWVLSRSHRTLVCLQTTLRQHRLVSLRQLAQMKRSFGLLVPFIRKRRSQKNKFLLRGLSVTVLSQS